MNTNAAVFAVEDIVFLAVYLGVSYLVILKFPQPVYIIVITAVVLSVISVSMGVGGGFTESKTLLKSHTDLMYGLFGLSILAGIAHYAILMQRFTVAEAFGIAALIILCLAPVNALLLSNKVTH